MAFRSPASILTAALPDLRQHLPKTQADLDEVVAFLDKLDIRAIFVAAIPASEDERRDIIGDLATHSRTLDAFGKKAKRDDIKVLGAWMTFVRDLVWFAFQTRPAWLREGATDAQLAKLGDALPYELPLEVYALLKVTNGFAPGIYPLAQWDLFLGDVDTMIREYADIKGRHGADNYLPVFSANGNHLLVKLDDVLEMRKASPTLGVKGKRKVLRGGLLDYNHEEGLAAAQALSGIDSICRAIKPRDDL